MYGREPKGTLGSICGSWTDSRADEQMVLIYYVHMLCTTVNEALAEPQGNMEDNSRSRKHYYDQKKKIKAMEYKLGGPVLVHLL